MQGLYVNDASWLDTAGRLLIVAFFRDRRRPQSLEIPHRGPHQAPDALRTPMPAAAFWVGEVIEFVGCALLLANWHPAIGVLCADRVHGAGDRAAAALLGDGQSDEADRHAERLLSNIAILGGLLLLLQNVR